MVTGTLAPKEMSEAAAIREYFLKDMSASDAIKQIRELTPADKTELAQGAAKQLGAVIKPA